MDLVAVFLRIFFHVKKKIKKEVGLPHRDQHEEYNMHLLWVKWYGVEDGTKSLRTNAAYETNKGLD